MSTVIHRRVAEARAGTNPQVITQVPSGWVVLGDNQFLRGYSLLLPDPVVPTLNDLDTRQRARFLEDMGLLGDALLRITGAVRINYEILGNLEPALHAHAFPRYSTEVPELRTKPVWFYEQPKESAFDVARHASLMEDIRRELQRLYAALGLEMIRV